LASTSPTSGGRSVGIVHSRTKATELLLLWRWSHNLYSLKNKSSPFTACE
jgi:hypothetical protein